MDDLTIAAASGMRSRLDSLDMLANNLANTATTGYKADREFYGLYASPEAGGGDAPATLPVVERHWTDFRQGTLTPTGGPLDFALSGEGFFAVNGPRGTLFTRNGSFRLSAAGVLTTAEGYAVRSETGAPIQANSNAPLEVAPDGAVRQNGQTLGRLAVASIGNPGAAEKLAGNYFAADAASVKPASQFEVHQGKLEASNVGAPESAVRLIALMRQFEMLQRAVTIGSDMSRRAVEEVARVNS